MKTGKRCRSLALVIVLVMSLLALPAAAAKTVGFGGGNGSKEKPYQINTAEQFTYFANLINGDGGYGDYCGRAKSWLKYYELNIDIDLKSAEWTPIGNARAMDDNDYATFFGYFDGKGHTVKNLKITKAHPYNGLFGYCDAGAIRNLRVTNAVIDIAPTQLSCTGIIAGHACDVSNVLAEGKITVRARNTGCSIGGAFGDIATAMDVEAKTDIKMTSSTDKGYDTAYSSSIGGFTGSSGGLAIGGVTAGSISAEIDYGTLRIGGYAGSSGAQYPLENIVSSVDIVGTSTWSPVMVGGITGQRQNGGLKNCLNTGDINISANSVKLGGLCGWFTGSSVIYALNSMKDCASTGRITATQNDSNYAAGNRIGGLVGYLDTATIDNCYHRGDISANFSSVQFLGIGGVVGSTELDSNSAKNNASLSNCYSVGEILSSGSASDVYIGGLTGILEKRGEAAYQAICANNIAAGTAVGVVNDGIVKNNSSSISDISNRSRMETLGFDFTNTWEMGKDGYAILQGLNYSQISPIQAKPAADPFASVDLHLWALIPAQRAYHRNIIDLTVMGKDYTAIATRYQLCDMLVRLIEEETKTELPAAAANTFTDCNKTTVLKGYQAGIVSGYGNGRFNPNAPINRQTFAAMLGKAIQYVYNFRGEKLVYTSVMKKYPDIASIPDWAYEGMDILTGYLHSIGGTIVQPRLAPKDPVILQDCLSKVMDTMDYLDQYVKIG